MLWIYSLRDPSDRWTREDKLAHVGWAAYAFTLGGWWLVILGGLAVEGVEVWRYLRWLKAGRPGPWPFFTDKVSLKDLLANLVGGALAALVGAVL